MPDRTPDDPFADLFGKLPDARTRRISSEDTADETGSADGAPATAPPSIDDREASGAAEKSAPDTPPAPAAPPLSRREAREAAARAAAAAATSRDASGHDRAVPGDDPARRASTAAPADSEPVRATTDAASRAAEPAPRSASAAVDAAVTLEETTAPTTPRASYARSGAAEPAPTDRSGAVSTPGLEDLFAGETSTDDVGSAPPRPNRRRRRIGGWIALGVVLAIFGGLAAGGWYVWTTYEDQIRAVMGWEEPNDYEDGLANGEAILTIVSGDTGASISPKLYESGVTMTPEAFYDYLIDEGLNPPFEPGVFQLQRQMSSAAALEAIMDPANRLENTAQLREGLTVEQSLPILSESLGIPLEDFQAAVADPSAYGVSADSLEGWLFPATYTFTPEVTAVEVVQTLVNRAVQSLDAAGVPEADRQRILTIASIIQREARFEEDMQKVSTVIVNRLDPDNQETFGLLQMDSTAQYGYGEMHDGTVSSSEEALTDDNPWNTYVYPGLPIGPISNPGDTAIASAMNPAEGEWLYFVTVNLDTGETVFTTNIDDHNRAVDQWISWCRDNPDSGC
ncbi:endolytic transglycosylase MltG [Microbacterium koreense]|uniref:Endolytic murein transglycosylase n=2 Tax=Microbacterium koreense TaxID=323761 RepID=A0ABW2ZSY8_9MICO